MSTPKTALITGTSTGFGRLAAEKLAAAGFRVFGTMRDTAGRNAANKRELESLGVTVVELDVTDGASVDRAAEAVLTQTGGTLDILVNNAGTAHMGVTESFTAESLTEQLATNVVGPMRVTRAFLSSMRERKSGTVVFVSSQVGRVIYPYTGVYSSSKWAIEALAESLSYELRPFNVEVAIVQPGAYATNIFNSVVAPDDAKTLEAYGGYDKTFGILAASMNEHAGDPVEVADAILALVQQEPGTLPLRTPVPAESTAAQINAVVAPIQLGMLEASGFGALLPKEPAIA
jgi:NAD(P)-dependent dehydrogenase (short-subunit alcohol dehydrogenase family)